MAVENALTKAFESVNGTVLNKERFIAASFDEKSLGIWLNIIAALETGYNLLKKNCRMSTGTYTFVIGKDIPVIEMENVCRTLASLHGENGIWCTLEIKKALNLYCSFENKDFAVRAGATGDYVQVKHIETISRNIRRSQEAFPFSDKIVQTIKQEPGKNIVFSGPDFIGKREGIYRFCSYAGAIPPLILRFRRNANMGIGAITGAAIGAFADILSPKIHAFLSTGHGQKQIELLDTLKTIISRERLRNEYSLVLVGNIRRFFRTLLDVYVAEVKTKGTRPILVLENLHNADPTAQDIFFDVYNTFKSDITVYGTCLDKKEKSEIISKWETIFSKNIVLERDAGVPVVNIWEMSADLWELSYTFNLLSKFFPGYMFPRLFEETGKNPALLIRVFALLARIGVIDFVDDPVPRIQNFTMHAERFLGNRKQLIYDFAKTCLLQAVSQGKLSACYNLIEALADLQADISDTLIWNALRSDVLNGTTAKISRSIAENRFDLITGKERGPAGRYLFQTFNALVHGDEKTIQNAFASNAPDTNSSLYQVQILINSACYYLGTKQETQAFEVLKKALRINQEQKKDGYAKVFRLIALVKLLHGKLNEAAEYSVIAVKHAEKQGAIDELGVSSYYAANIQYLLGNLSKSERLAHNAEHNAVMAGCYDWADRARLLRSKLRFEFGFYRDALRLLEKTFENLSGSITENMKNTIKAWIFRAKFFSTGNTADFSNGSYSGSTADIFTDIPTDTPAALSNIDDGLDDPASLNLDMLLFKMEASYLSGDYKTTLALSETITKNIPVEGFLWTERPDWRSGFAQGELLNMPERDFWGRKASVYHSLALCKLSTDAAGKKQAVSDMSWLTTNEVIPGTDTNDSFYFYALYRILRESGASLIDINTVVGLAYKRLQQRSLKIDDPEARRVFLNRPYWNNALHNAAKEYKLV